MSKHRGKAKRKACWVQTKRSPKNKHKWEKQVNYAKRMQNRTKYFHAKSKEQHYVI